MTINSDCVAIGLASINALAINLTEPLQTLVDICFRPIASLPSSFHFAFFILQYSLIIILQFRPGTRRRHLRRNCPKVGLKQRVAFAAVVVSCWLDESEND